MTGQRLYGATEQASPRPSPPHRSIAAFTGACCRKSSIFACYCFVLRRVRPDTAVVVISPPPATR
ncbi:hypothetical protein KCP73_25970 [Salmonella enterica subsp. enterica]|nr:hypothetical protein KCP73_25970 [Salmonella enterica subsp. enterica]